MSKRKKSKDEIVNLIRSFWTRKRADRKYTVPNDYLLGLADNLWRQNPSKAIVFNTIKDVWCRAFSSGWTRRGDDMLFFKAKREKALKEDFDKFKDELDDIIHSKAS